MFTRNWSECFGVDRRVVVELKKRNLDDIVNDGEKENKKNKCIIHVETCDIRNLFTVLDGPHLDFLNMKYPLSYARDLRAIDEISEKSAPTKTKQ